MSGARPVPEPAQVVPDGVAVQDLPFAGVFPGADGCGDPAFEFQQPLVTGRQCADGDQDAAHTGECLIRGELVKDLVGQPAGLAAGLAEELAGLGPCHPDPGPGGTNGAPPAAPAIPRPSPSAA